jgi:hypothetical protein
MQQKHGGSTFVGGEIMGITQILHEQGFDDHMPVCHQI